MTDNLEINVRVELRSPEDTYICVEKDLVVTPEEARAQQRQVGSDVLEQFDAICSDLVADLERVIVTRANGL